MINLKITMISGEFYKIRNFVSLNVEDFIKSVLTRAGTFAKWYEVLPEVFIKVENIQSIERIQPTEKTSSKPENEVVLPEDVENLEIDFNVDVGNGETK